MEYALGIAAAVIAFLVYKVRELLSDKQLSSTQKEDAILATKEETVKAEIEKARKELAVINPEKAKVLPDDEVVKFWKDKLQ